MAITDKKMKQIVEDVAAVVGSHPNEVFYADHNHEELTEGAWSISLDGHLGGIEAAYLYDWTEISQKHGVLIECLNHWCLAVYPLDSPHWDDLYRTGVFTR